MDEQHWYLRVRGQVLGPLTVEQLRALQERGQFRRFHEVSSDQQSWQPAWSVAELVPLLQTAEEVEIESGPPGWPATVPLRGTKLWQAIAELPSPPPPPVVSPPEPASPVRTFLNWRDGLWALRVLMADPVQGLPRLCHTLSLFAALRLGLVLWLVFGLCLALGALLAGPQAGLVLSLAPTLPPAPEELLSVARLRFSGRVLLIALLLPAGLSGVVMAVRALARSLGNLGGDVLIAGASLLPWGLVVPLAVLAGMIRADLGILLCLAGGCPAVLILHGALTQVGRLSGWAALLLVPLALMGIFLLFQAAYVGLVAG